MQNLKLTRRYVAAVAVIACFGLSKTASAGLQLVVSESVGASVNHVTILDNGPLDSNPATGVINVNTSALDPLLVNASFSSLSVNSDAPGISTSSNINESGVVSLTNPTIAAQLLLEASDTNFLIPGSSGALYSSLSGTFTSSQLGSGLRWSSFYNPANTNGTGAGTISAAMLGFVSTGLTVNSNSLTTTPDTIAALQVPYGLSNQMQIQLNGDSAGGPLSVVQFSGATQIVPTPEPGTLALITLPLALLMKRNRQTK